MSARRKSSLQAERYELIPDDYFAPLDLSRVFGNDRPLEVDLGCGDGAYLAALAERNPKRNFLGTERLVGRVASTARKLAVRRLANARVLRIEIGYAVKYLLRPGSVAAFHLLFPDPWPKRRHHVRRIFTAEFAASLHTALEPAGLLRIATDQRDYFEQMLAIAQGDFSHLKHDISCDTPTTFEGQYLAAAVPIHRVLLRKISGER